MQWNKMVKLQRRMLISVSYSFDHETSAETYENHNRQSAKKQTNQLPDQKNNEQIVVVLPFIAY